MIPYFGMHSMQNKQTMRNKGTRFGYKNFVLTRSDGYSYHIIPYCGAKEIAGIPGKDLTSRAVIEFILKMKNTEANLTFDNWYASAKLMSLLNALKIPTICTVRANHVATVPLLSIKQMAKKKRGAFSYAFDEEVGLHCVRWMDNSVVKVISNCTSSYPTENVDRFARSEQRKVQVGRPNLIKVYSQTMREC